MRLPENLLEFFRISVIDNKISDFILYLLDKSIKMIQRIVVHQWCFNQLHKTLILQFKLVLSLNFSQLTSKISLYLFFDVGSAQFFA